MKGGICLRLHCSDPISSVHAAEGSLQQRTHFLFGRKPNRRMLIVPVCWTYLYGCCINIWCNRSSPSTSVPSTPASLSGEATGLLLTDIPVRAAVQKQ